MSQKISQIGLSELGRNTILLHYVITELVNMAKILNVHTTTSFSSEEQLVLDGLTEKEKHAHVLRAECINGLGIKALYTLVTLKKSLLSTLPPTSQKVLSSAETANYLDDILNSLECLSSLASDMAKFDRSLTL